MSSISCVIKKWIFCRHLAQLPFRDQTLTSSIPQCPGFLAQWKIWPRTKESQLQQLNLICPLWCWIIWREGRHPLPPPLPLKKRWSLFPPSRTRRSSVNWFPESWTFPLRWRRRAQLPPVAASLWSQQLNQPPYPRKSNSSIIFKFSLSYKKVRLQLI